ncbi:hypothetical protein SAMN05660209_05172 [Geodermatophilus africanus]|uniref:ABC-2 type transport system permease protein n=1 Tax=Geodermatophilus africanus TaxID=1137993 RepID=A0A1H3RJ36_9ACTN|nr:hypothetical protein [Geodermatophilus africanus]SDZ24949.1 hypothetical protein SAMN05660209_05172 [Geodermatophilus africanus]
MGGGGLAFALNWALWRLADLRRQGEDAVTGGVLALYVTVLCVFVEAVTQLLPFAMGISLSRRAYLFGAAVYAMAMSLAYGLALAVLTSVETATDGWGVGLTFWAPGPVKADNFPLQVAMSGSPLLAFAFIGIGIGIAYKRWGTNGVWGLTLLGILVLGGSTVLITWRSWWDEIGLLLSDLPSAALLIGLPAAIAVTAAALSFAGIRHVVP